MPYDPLGSSFGQWSRGGTAPGLRSIYGYGDQGAMYSPQNPNPAQSPPAMQPNVGMSQVGPQGDFFTQLAGLMGVSPTQPSQKPLSPAQYNYARNQYQPGGPVHGGNIQSFLGYANDAARQANRSNPMNQGINRATPFLGSGSTSYGPASAPTQGSPMNVPAGPAPRLMAGNSPVLGEKNPIDGMPSRRYAPQSSGRASRGRNVPSRANFNYQMGGNG